MAQPKVILPCETGYHNSDLEAAAERIKNSKQYRNLSTAILIPTRGQIHAQVVQSWFYLYTPANNAVGRYFSQAFEVGDAYNAGIATILNDPNLGKFSYLLTLEDDNIPPHDGLLRLLESICDCDVPCKEHFTVVGGLYWTKGEEGIPMIYGDPSSEKLDFRPRIPEPDTVMECNGTPMGFTLFHMGLFKDPAIGSIEDPWFATKQVRDAEAFKIYTQDLYFMQRLRTAGYRVAIDTSVKVGHFDSETETVW